MGLQLLGKKGGVCVCVNVCVCMIYAHKCCSVPEASRKQFSGHSMTGSRSDASDIS